jgi:predicted nucleic-acid-binding protein
MIGLDTNVLLRLLLADDEAQFRKARQIVATVSGTVGGVLLTDVVLAELVWTLRAAYRRSKEEVVAALDALLAQPAFAFEDRNLVIAALAVYRDGPGDFADYLVAARNAAHGVTTTYSFDKALRGAAGVTVV